MGARSGHRVGGRLAAVVRCAADDRTEDECAAEDDQRGEERTSPDSCYALFLFLFFSDYNSCYLISKEFFLVRRKSQKHYNKQQRSFNSKKQPQRDHGGDFFLSDLTDTPKTKRGKKIPTRS